VDPLAARSAGATAGERSAGGLGRVAPVLLAVGLGVLLCSVANALARATVGPATATYWVGLALLALPVFYVLLGSRAGAGERLALVCALGLGIYLVKISRDAPSFTFSDELIHAFNAEQIRIHGDLFRGNPILEVTPYYPGLEGATSALVKITGVSVYTSGVIVVGAARLTLVAALFLLFRRVSGSARTAGLAAAIYATNFNFLFWGAQYAYESLALPLLALAMLLLAEREVSWRERLREWAWPLAIATLAIVVTHHLTSYALVTVLVFLSLALWWLRRNWDPPNPWPLAAATVLLVLVWLAVVAGSTVSYLSGPLSNALEALGNTIAGEEPPRALFQGNADVGATPIGARAIALVGIGLLAVALPFGLLRCWRRYRGEPFALLFMAGSLGFFFALVLRLAPAAWETGNRASEFFFIGLAFVVSTVVAGLRLRRPSPRAAALLVTGGFAVVLAGGVISGWPWDTQLAKPLRVEAAGRQIVSPPLAVAEWAHRELPEGRFAAPAADANLLLVPGDVYVKAGAGPDVQDVLSEPVLAPWQLAILRDNELRYVVADRREVASDGLRGYYFPLDDDPAFDRLLPLGAVNKFAAVPGAARIYSNGLIDVYDMEGKP
jgi:hypothetical protein